MEQGKLRHEIQGAQLLSCPLHSIGAIVLAYALDLHGLFKGSCAKLLASNVHIHSPQQCALLQVALYEAKHKSPCGDIVTRSIVHATMIFIFLICRKRTLLWPEYLPATALLSAALAIRGNL